MSQADKIALIKKTGNSKAVHWVNKKSYEDKKQFYTKWRIATPNEIKASGWDQKESPRPESTKKKEIPLAQKKEEKEQAKKEYKK